MMELGMLDGYLICLLFAVKIVVIYIIYILYVCCEIYLYMSYIFVMKIVGFNKKQKKSQYADSLPSATDGNGLFAVYRGRQRGHVASSCASWELTHLVNLPTVADGKE